MRPSTSYPYTGQPSTVRDRCPICGAANNDCPDATPVLMPCPPVDLAEDTADAAGPLRRYTVIVNDTATVLWLNDSDAAHYGSAAVPTL